MISWAACWTAYVILISAGRWESARLSSELRLRVTRSFDLNWLHMTRLCLLLYTTSSSNGWENWDLRNFVCSNRRNFPVSQSNLDFINSKTCSLSFRGLFACCIFDSQSSDLWNMTIGFSGLLPSAFFRPCHEPIRTFRKLRTRRPFRFGLFPWLWSLDFFFSS